MEDTQEEHSPYLSGAVPAECMRFMPVNLTATRGPRTVCTDAQRAPAQIERLGAQTSQGGSQPYSPSQNPTQFTCPLYPREKTYQGTTANVAAHQREVHPGERNSLLEKMGDRYKRHAAQIDTMHAKSAATFTQTSASTSLGAIEHPLKP